MAQLQVGNFSCTEAKISMPRYGIWNADLALDGNDATSLQGQQVTIVQDGGGPSLVGTCLEARTADAYETVLARIVGGAAGLSTSLTPKAYRQIPASIVWGDILREAGEVGSQATDQAFLGFQFPLWVRNRATGAQLLQMLVQGAGGTVWRVLADGTVWTGPETWPTYTDDTSVVMDSTPSENRMLVGPTTFGILPGSTYQGVQASYVEHVLSRQGTLRTTIWGED